MKSDTKRKVDGRSFRIGAALPYSGWPFSGVVEVLTFTMHGFLTYLASGVLGFPVAALCGGTGDAGAGSVLRVALGFAYPALRSDLTVSPTPCQIASICSGWSCWSSLSDLVNVASHEDADMAV